MGMRIGSMFPLQEIGEKPSSFFSDRGFDVQYFLSGRCALYACLLDCGAADERKMAYVPAYTCETVLASYVKAGYGLRFYDVDTDELRPHFNYEDLENVSVLNLCGYNGFSRYDKAFLLACKRRNITIIQDTTHSMFSNDGHYEGADYYAGSVRKWLGIASGGVAVKKSGSFSIQPLAADEEHLKGRYKAMEYRKLAIKTGKDSYNELASSVFWETEMRLRRMFDAFASDEKSTNILNNLDPAQMIAKRRANYQTVLDSLQPSSQCRPIFPSLDDVTCPSHFSFYSENRAKAQQQLEQQGIKSTIYWPLPPMLTNKEQYQHASYIYDHVASVQIDQRYSREDMEYLGKELSSL
ncbi:MAG: hypothetical protein GX626_00365 [Spirochaetales bacterium]|nr:hypothetical protein [Spirochaetales bacterium]